MKRPLLTKSKILTLVAARSKLLIITEAGEKRLFFSASNFLMNIRNNELIIQYKYFLLFGPIQRRILMNYSIILNRHAGNGNAEKGMVVN